VRAKAQNLWSVCGCVPCSCTVSFAVALQKVGFIIKTEFVIDGPRISCGRDRMRVSKGNKVALRLGLDPLFGKMGGCGSKQLEIPCLKGGGIKSRNIFWQLRVQYYQKLSGIFSNKVWRHCVIRNDAFHRWIVSVCKESSVD